MKRNIEFFPNKIKYNAVKKFRKNIIKIPTYIIDEVFKRKLKIEIYHENKYVTTYSYDNLFSFVKNTESTEYKGKFRNKDITYKLTNVEI